MARAVLALGSNLGDRQDRLRIAIDAIQKLPKTTLLSIAKFYETEPIDVPEAYIDLKFLNSAVLVETTLTPEELLSETQRIETEQGRVRLERNGPRTLDIDLIMYEGVTMQTSVLTLPHPRAVERDFVLRPLADLGFSSSHLRLNKFDIV